MPLSKMRPPRCRISRNPSACSVTVCVKNSCTEFHDGLKDWIVADITSQMKGCGFHIRVFFLRKANLKINNNSTLPDVSPDCQ